MFGIGDFDSISYSHKIEKSPNSFAPAANPLRFSFSLITMCGENKNNLNTRQDCLSLRAGYEDKSKNDHYGHQRLLKNGYSSGN